MIYSNELTRSESRAICSCKALMILSLLGSSWDKLFLYLLLAFHDALFQISLFIV
jgi:hypothetical protein